MFLYKPGRRRVEMLGSRSRRHQSSKEAVNAESTYAFQQGERVITIEGYPGIVEGVIAGPYPGSEIYMVKLDGGMGGGQYADTELSMGRHLMHRDSGSAF